MASVIKIKRSTGGDVPGSLSAGELAVTYGASGTGPKRLFVGNSAGNGLIVIGGEVFADMLDHTAGTLTASSALLADSNSALSSVIVGNNASAAGTLVFNEGTNNGTAKITLAGVADVGASNKTITLPNATDTLIGKATTDTLTNKTLTSPKINENVVMSATATELNLIDGSSAGTIANSKAVIYGSSGEVNATTLQIAGTSISSTAAELNKLDGVTATTTELNYLDVTTLGTSEVSKAVTVDANGDLVIPDSDKFKFGAGSDMQLYHDGTNSYITNAEGALKVATETSGIAVSIGHTTSETTINDNLTVTGTLTGTLATAAQGSVTSLGTLTALTVDNVAIDGKVLTMTGSTNDTAVFTAGTNGTLSIVTTDTAAAAANIQITADGTVDIDSAGALTLDSGAAINLEPAAGSAIVLDGTINVDAGVVTGATSITSTAFVGTLSTAAQANITSLGTLTSLTVDNIIINGTNIGHTSDTNAIAISSGGVVTMDQIPVFSAGINVSGGTIAGTLATAAQTNITSLGTLTALTVDNVAINGSTIGHTGDTDLMTVASGILTVAGEVQMTTLDIGGTNVTSTAAELNLIDGGTSRGTTAVASGDGILINDDGTMRMTNVDTVSTYFSSHNVGGGNIVTTGALNSGSITSGFGTINNGSSTITTSGAITGGSLVADLTTIDSNGITTSSGDFTINPAGNIAVGSNRITGLSDPSSAQDAATKAYVDAVKTGLDVKDSVRVATTANITIADDLDAGDTIDGVTLVAGDRVLVKNQSTGSQNGIYVSHATTPFRATDFDADAEVTAGAFTFVEEGTTNADSGWVLTTNDDITVGSTAIAFAQFSGAGQVTAGTGLTKSGNTINAIGTADRISVAADAINIDTGYIGQTSLTTLGTIGTGTWEATDVAVAHGGTGVSTFTSNGILYGNGTGAVQVTAAGTDTYFLYSNSGTPAWTNSIDGGTF